MTTPQVPANSLSVSEISDEINSPGYTQGEQDVGANAVVRQLTGTASKSRQGVELLIGADLQNKTAYSEIIASAATNTQISVGNVTSEITLTANSDMFEPNMTWSFVINGDSSNVVSSDITITKLSDVSKQAIVSLLTTGGTKQANLTVTGVMTIGQHVVNTCTRDIRLTTTSSNTALSVTATPSFTLDASGVVAQTAVITVKASANASLASDTTFVFTPTFVTGTGALTPDIKADSVTFVATAATPIVNSAIYNLTTDMFYQGRKVSTNNVTVDIRAEYQDRIITSIIPSATVNNNFANSGSQYATIDVVATHNAVGPTFTQGTITFTVEVTGNTVTQQTISSNTSQKTERISLYHDFDTDSFGFKKAVVNVVATLRSPTNQIIDQKRVDGLVLRAGAYGLSVVEASSNSQIGYSAQTSTTQATASWRAGDFSWSTREFGGSGPTNIITVDNNTRTSRVDIRSTTPSAKNRSQAITNTSSFDITGTLSFDNVTARVVTINDILIKSESLPYTYTISTPSLSNTQMEIDGSTVASITVTGTTSVGTITWTRDNGSVGITTTSTTANVFVTSSSSGGTNTQSVIVTGNLLDPTSRVIEPLSTQSISLDSATTKLQILGESVSKTSNQQSDIVVGSYESAAVVGTHSLIFPPAKISGDTLEVVRDVIPQRLAIIATATQASKSGTYLITGTVDYKGITRTTNKTVTVALNALAPSLNVTKFPFEYTTYEIIPGGLGFREEFLSDTNFAIVTRNGLDIVTETDYPGTINVDYTIQAVVHQMDFIGITQTVFNQAANTDPAPDGHPSSINKRRDRLDVAINAPQTPRYNITYELRDSANTLLLSNTVTDTSSSSLPATGNITLTAGPSGSKYFTIVDKPVNGFGFHEAHPATVTLSQNVAYTASFTSVTTIPNPRFIFSSSGGATVFANTINGQANLVGQSIYTDSEPPTRSIVSNQSTIRAQLSTDGRPLGTTASQNFNFSLPLPPGRCYRLATFSANGVRQQHTRDPFGNSNEQVNYSRVPSAASLMGPETKWMGFHDGSRIYEQSQRPLYHSSGKRLYSSAAHRSQHGNEQPNEIIPTNYFIIMSFSETGTPSIGSVYLVGVDDVIYGPLKLYTAGSQNDTRRDNDAFHFAIYEWNGSVACNYCFISNASGDGFTPPPGRPPSGPLELRAAQIGSVQIADRVDLNIGNIVGGFVSEDTSSGNVGDVELLGGGTFSGTDSLISLSER
jgi:hypothetical protein